MTDSFSISDVHIRDVAPVSVAIMEHHGDPAKIGDTIQRFIAWRKNTGLSPKTSPTFNIFHSDPRSTPPEDYRLSLCVGTDRSFEGNDVGIASGTIAGGRCAVLRVVGNTDNLEGAAQFLYRDWLPASGEEAADAPLYCQRIAFFPDVPEKDAIADLFLPLKS